MGTGGLILGGALLLVGMAIVGIVVWRTRRREPVLPPALCAIDFMKDIYDLDQERFLPVDRAARNEGFFYRLDYRLDDSISSYFGRIYVHPESKTVLAARMPRKGKGQKIVYELYSSFEDGTHLLTTNLKEMTPRRLAPNVLLLKMPEKESLFECYTQHKVRLYDEVHSEKRRVVFDDSQKLLSFVKEINTP